MLFNDRYPSGMSRYVGIFYEAASRIFYPKYENRCFVIGKNVEIVRPSADDGNVESARVIALDDECRLVVEHTDGRLETLSSGEVRLKSWQTEE